MTIVNGIIAMLSVIVASLVNTAFLVALVAGMIGGFIRGRRAIAAALAFEEPLVEVTPRGPARRAAAPA